MPGNFLVVEDFRRLLCEFTADLAPTHYLPTGATDKDADYDPLRLRPVTDVASSIEKLLGIATEVPIEWRFGEYLVANTSNLLTARAMSSRDIGEALDVLLENQAILTNARTISHKSAREGELAAIHHAESVHHPVIRFIHNSFVAAKLAHIFEVYPDSGKQHRLDRQAQSFGSLMQRFDRELDFIDIEYRESEVTFAFPRDTLNCKLPGMDDQLRMAIDGELRRKAAEVPVTGKWKDRIKLHIRSNRLSDISLDEICDSFRVQRRTLGRLLRDEGTTFTNIVTELRREKALHLVRHTGVPLKRVASELGFNSDASFNMAFKSWTGTTPMKFRKSVPARAANFNAQPAELALAAEPKKSLRPGLLLTSWSNRAST